MFDITQFYEYREDNRMEVKKAKGGLPVSLWDTYSSFANCYGGVIILGVAENKDGTFRRNWEGDYHCNRNEVLAMLRDQPEATSDMKVLERISVEDLDLETVHGYRNRHMTFKPGHTWEKYDDIKYMEKLGAVAISESDGKLHPTAAGILMFGEEYLIVREFPEYFLDYREMLDPSIRWTDRFQSSSGDWTGNLFEFYFRVYNKIAKDLKIPFKIEAGNRIDDTPVHKAIREALANCLINTDYYGRCGIVIKKEPDCIIMENPGDVRTGKEQMLLGGVSDPRNKTIMKMFNMINVGERAGSGVPDIYSVWENEGWKEPVIEEKYNPDRTILTLSFEKKKTTKKSDGKKADEKRVTKKTMQQYEVVMNFMKVGIEYKLSDISTVIGVKETRTKEILKGLIEAGSIETVGSTKAKKYRKVD